MPPDRRDATAAAEPIRAEPRVRRGLAHAVIAILIAGHALSIGFAAELFPFSYYPMFSRSLAGRRDYQQLALVGVSQGREIALDRQWIRAATSIRIKHLRRLFEQASRLDAQRVPGLLRDVLRAYDELRASERPDLPELSGLRLYREVYRLENYAENRQRPERRVRIDEVERQAGPERAR